MTKSFGEVGTKIMIVNKITSTFILASTWIFRHRRPMQFMNYIHFLKYLFLRSRVCSQFFFLYIYLKIFQELHPVLLYNSNSTVLGVLQDTPVSWVTHDRCTERGPLTLVFFFKIILLNVNIKRFWEKTRFWVLNLSTHHCPCI